MTKDTRGGVGAVPVPTMGNEEESMTTLGPIPFPPTTGLERITESGPKPGGAEGRGVQSNHEAVAHGKGHMPLVRH